MITAFKNYFIDYYGLIKKHWKLILGCNLISGIVAAVIWFGFYNNSMKITRIERKEKLEDF